MGMATGENTRLSAMLLIEQYRRNRLADAARHTWVEAGYCIDAPELIAAGSHERDIFGDGDDDWLAMPTAIPREPSNADVTGLPPAQTVELPPKPAGGRSELS